MKRKQPWRKLLAAAALLTAVAACGLREELVVQHYVLASEKIGAPVTMVLISDLHSCIFGEAQQELLELIAAQQPDLILLTGDIVDDRASTVGAELFFEGIRGMCPAYYVTGNHEFRSRRIGDYRKMIESYGVTILSDAWEQININGNWILIGGVEDPLKRRYEDESYVQEDAMEAAFSHLPAGDYKLLLAHRPERADFYAPYGFDLVVSGHAHGGQVRIPWLLNGLYAPNQGWFPEAAGGLYQRETLTQIVSRGLAVYPKLPRIFNPPEVVVITLEGFE